MAVIQLPISIYWFLTRITWSSKFRRFNIFKFFLNHTQFFRSNFLAINTICIGHQAITICSMSSFIKSKFTVFFQYTTNTTLSLSGRNVGEISHREFSFKVIIAKKDLPVKGGLRVSDIRRVCTKDSELFIQLIKTSLFFDDDLGRFCQV